MFKVKKREAPGLLSDVSADIILSVWGKVGELVVPSLADVPVRGLLDDGLLAGQVELFDNLVDGLGTLVDPRANGDDVLFMFSVLGHRVHRLTVLFLVHLAHLDVSLYGFLG